jgi:hypothetical protein
MHYAFNIEVLASTQGVTRTAEPIDVEGYIFKRHNQFQYSCLEELALIKWNISFLSLGLDSNVIRYNFFACINEGANAQTTHVAGRILESII